MDIKSFLEWSNERYKYRLGSWYVCILASNETSKLNYLTLTQMRGLKEMSLQLTPKPVGKKTSFQ